jgi:hypothetical protein
VFRCRRRVDIISLPRLPEVEAWSPGGGRGRTAVRGYKHAVARCEQSRSLALSLSLGGFSSRDSKVPPHPATRRVS